MGLSEAMENRLQVARRRSDFGNWRNGLWSGRSRPNCKKTVCRCRVSPRKMSKARCKNVDGKKVLASFRGIFSRMTNECLNYFLSKTLTGQVGDGRRFNSMVRCKPLKTRCERIVRKHRRSSRISAADGFPNIILKKAVASNGTAPKIRLVWIGENAPGIGREGEGICVTTGISFPAAD